MNRNVLNGIIIILALLMTFYIISSSRSLRGIFRTAAMAFTEMPEEQAAVSASETTGAEYPSLCKNTFHYDYSPNGLWRAEFCVSEMDKRLVLTVSNRETKALWEMSYRDYVPNPDLVSDGGMLVSHWSMDGRYAYFSSYMNGSGGGCFSPHSDGGWGLFRLDLQTGNVMTILPVAYDRSVYYDYSFSPTDRRLAYRVNQESLVILEIPTGETIDVNHVKDFGDEGGFVWSEDSLGFVYSTGTFSSDSELYSMRLVDARTGEEQILLESFGDCFLATEWKDDGILLIERIGLYGYKRILEFDLESHSIIINETLVNP